MSLLQNIGRQAPYVLSDDLADLFSEWGKAAGVTVPSPSYFVTMLERVEHSLKSIFSDVHIIREDDIRQSFRAVYEETTNLIVSIDRVYMSRVVEEAFPGYLDITRAVNERFETIGLISRHKSWTPFSDSIEHLQAAVDKLPTSYSGKEVILVDDVVFSGTTISKIMSALNNRGIRVKKVVAGVSIGQSQKTLADNDIELKSTHHFDDVIDEVCCRDLIIGAPYGGRTVIIGYHERDRGIGGTDLRYAPYLLPFGDPEKWASIPKENVLQFSIDMLDVSADLWREIQQLNFKEFSTRELGCRVHGLPERDSVGQAIREVKESLKS